MTCTALLLKIQMIRYVTFLNLFCSFTFEHINLIHVLNWVPALMLYSNLAMPLILTKISQFDKTLCRLSLVSIQCCENGPLAAVFFKCGELSLAY